MKILFSTPFSPAIGGLETVMEIFAEECASLGHSIQVATHVPAGGLDAASRFSFPIHYQPAYKQLFDLIKWCDVYVQGCVGLKMLWPLLLFRRKYAVTHQTWYRRSDGKRGLKNRSKLAVSKRAINIAPSQAIANDLNAACTVIPNPYRAQIFNIVPRADRHKSLLFVGRLVSDKGADLLLSALVILRDNGLQPDLTIVGDGPEMHPLQHSVDQLGLKAQVTFVGPQPAEKVAVLMNSHRVLVIPSRWSEPFGVVAVEGIACGCLVLGSEQGGLSDAIGPCGCTFPNGDVTALAMRIEELLDPAQSDKVCPMMRENHLAIHQPAAVTKRYLEVILSGHHP